MSERAICGNCNGSGEGMWNESTCHYCDGSGEIGDSAEKELAEEFQAEIREDIASQ